VYAVNGLYKELISDSIQIDAKILWFKNLQQLQSEGYAPRTKKSFQFLFMKSTYSVIDHNLHTNGRRGMFMDIFPSPIEKRIEEERRIVLVL
jgi:hypothetical protein